MNKLNQEELVFPAVNSCKWYEQQETLVYSKVKLVLNDEIKEPSYYTDVLNRIDSLQEGDILEIHIDTVGGDLDGCIAIIDAIENTQAEVIGSIKNKAYSAGSAIALSCPNLNIAPTARMMIHAWSGGFGGKSNEVVSNYEFNTKFLSDWFNTVYKGFLSDKEIQEVHQGKDFYFNADQIIERLGRKNQILSREYKKQVKDEAKKSKQIKEKVVASEEV